MSSGKLLLSKCLNLILSPISTEKRLIASILMSFKLKINFILKTPITKQGSPRLNQIKQ